MEPKIDYPRLAAELRQHASTSIASGVRFIEKKLPHIAMQIRKDVRRGGPLPFWGRSRNHDELAGTQMVDPAILDVIAELSGVRLCHVTPHAGLQHTYGYLFSTVETPFGFKRDRWLGTEISGPFHLHSTTLGPAPNDGTLLCNATWFASNFAYRRQREHLRRIQKRLAARVSPDLRKASLIAEHVRITQRVSRTWYGRQRTWILQTDVVTAGNGPSVLIYSIASPTTKSHKLTTLFPVSESGKVDLIKQAESTRLAEVEPRFNAYHPALNKPLKARWKVHRF